MMAATPGMGVKGIVDAEWMQCRCRADAERMQSGCRVDAEWMHSRCRVDAERIQSGCRVAEWVNSVDA